MSSIQDDPFSAIRARIDPERLVATAVRLIEAPSPTLSAGPAANALAALLFEDGFVVERPNADWPQAPAVVTRLASGRPGPTLQFDGHLDTVHLPFVPPRVADGKLYGSGASDMKGGIAAFVEALRVLREGDLLPGGAILLTAHDHHEGPWGDRRQLSALIREGYVGDAVLLPEYLADRLPVAGRGMTIFEITVRRDGEPVHEVLRPADQPDVIQIGVEVVNRLRALHAQVSQVSAPYAGSDSVFVGSIQAGEIYNQSPTTCRIQGTRRWVTPGATDAACGELEEMMASVAKQNGVDVQLTLEVQSDAFRLDPGCALATAFQQAHQGIVGAALPLGDKPFVDDGTLFTALAGIPAITHGPAASGAHTVYEEVSIDELVRVAQVYALTAVHFCNAAI